MFFVNFDVRECVGIFWKVVGIYGFSVAKMAGIFVEM